MILFPELFQKSNQLIERMKELGHTIIIQQGYRSFEEQDRLFAQGRTVPGKIVTNAKGGQSWHNFALATDLVFQVNGKPSWTEIHPWELMGKIGKELGLEWGGDWKKLPDRPHFQITKGLSLEKAQQLYKLGGLNKVWETIC